jgi:hypothetical protein
MGIQSFHISSIKISNRLKPLLSIFLRLQGNLLVRKMKALGRAEAWRGFWLEEVLVPEIGINDVLIKIEPPQSKIT